MITTTLKALKNLVDLGHAIDITEYTKKDLENLLAKEGGLTTIAYAEGELRTNGALYHG